jgi:hypothetical protein
MSTSSLSRTGRARRTFAGFLAREKRRGAPRGPEHLFSAILAVQREERVRVTPRPAPTTVRAPRTCAARTHARERRSARARRSASSSPTASADPGGGDAGDPDPAGSAAPTSGVRP